MRGDRAFLPCAILAVALVTGVALAPSSSAIGWALVNAKIRADFPDLSRISTVELAEWLADESRPAPLLLDVRTRPEYDVSHLAGARHVLPGADVASVQETRSRPVVTYCSVGYRSGAFAAKLQKAGWLKVCNLEGSIFRWANEGRPLAQGAQKAEHVHPYNRTWGLLLRKKRRADVPSIETPANRPEGRGK